MIVWLDMSTESTATMTATIAPLDNQTIEQEFLTHFNNIEDKVTYQNATQSYLRVRPNVTLGSARVLGHHIVTKNLNLLTREHMSKKGFTLAIMIEYATKRMMESKNPQWFDRVAKLMGYENPVLLQQNFQFNNNMSANNDTPILEASQGDKQEFTQDFVEFLKAKHAKKPEVEEGKISP